TCSAIVPLELFPLRARSRALSLSMMCHQAGVLVLHYIHKSVAGYRSLRLTGALWIVLAMVAALFGTYVFFALPETSGIVFEDADELFDVEDYDTTALCCPKGSGSGFVGFRSMSHGGARFKVYAPRARQTNVVGPSPQ
ncbi:unnamed protein product, partial [Symbiodinium microadriaticum]